jgi:uncharacterized repeat protein (TIGR02543 family)
MKNLYKFLSIAALAAIIGLAAAGCKMDDDDDIPATYTVTFATNGGSPVAAITDVASDAKIAAPPVPTKAGNNFAGWHKEAALITQWNFAVDTVSADTTLYAKWTVIATYTVTYDGNGSTGGAVPIDANSPYESGATVTALDNTGNLEKAGHAFDGWNTEADGSGTDYAANATFTITVDTTLYAKWTVTTHTVTYDADGGTPASQTRTVNDGASVGASDMPDEPTMSSHTFGGWYTEANGAGTQFTADTTVDGDITVYAKWTAANLSDLSSLAESLTWLANNAEEGGEYTITVSANETIAPTTLSYSGKRVSITLDGGEAERTVTLGSTGSLFTVGSGVTLTLDNNVTLRGRSNNTVSLIQVNRSGALVMNTGSKVGNNTATGVIIDPPTYNLYGGGVSVSGTFTMNGGEISGNNVSLSSSHRIALYVYGGGVSVSGTFTMNGGTISGNRVSSSSSSSYSGFIPYVYGGGVYVASGTFAMNGGTISGNTASSSREAYGGGVYVSGGTFTLTDGTISGNTASASPAESYSSATSYGGGVAVSSGRLTMSGGTISNNTASSSNSSYGGGVYTGSTFTMSGGTISGNRAYSSSSATFTPYAYGGGVYVASGTFTKQVGGVIYGSDASALRNIAFQDRCGPAVYVQVTTTLYRFRSATAGPDVTLDSSIRGSAGGWEGNL